MSHPPAALRRLILLIVTALLPAPVLAVAGAAAPANACPAADPYSTACTSVVNYQVSGTDGALAVQATPKVDNVKRWVKEGATIGVICQINDGGTDPYDHLYSRTWDFTTAGGWVYDHYVTTKPQDANGWSPGVRPCGQGSTSSPKTVSIPRPTERPLSTLTTTQTTSLNPSAYPWPAQDAWAADGHGYYEGECTSFAAWAVRSDGLHHTQSPDWLGNAGMWHAPIDATPHVGDVAQWDGSRNGAGSAGHVGYVEAVYDNGTTVKIAEYNWGNFHRLNTRTIPASDPSRFLRF